MNKNVAFLGLGVMGYHMAGHLSKAGYNVTVYNRTESKTDKWLQEFRGNKDKIIEIVNKINNNLTLVEKVKKFLLINENFTIENGLLTPTMKVKRNKVTLKYKNILENFYKK